MTNGRPAAADAPSRDVAAVADSVIALLRSFGKARARMLAAAAHDVESSAHVLLKCVSGEGRIRASEVAEVLHSDPSTVSRQVATLVKDGLLERRADPADGRASLLALTSQGNAVLAEHDRIRMEHFARVLDDWTETDLRHFATMLRRFTEAYEAANGNWINDRVVTRAGRAGSSD